MPGYDLYSKRKRRLIEGQADVYVFDQIPLALRVQVLHIWSRITGIDLRFALNQHNQAVIKYFSRLYETLCTEYGTLSLVEDVPDWEVHEQCWEFLKRGTTEDVLDIVELSFQLLTTTNDYIFQAFEAIEELNHRFREHCVGYQYVEGMIMRVDSLYAHSEIVLPALRLLNQAGFAGASQEFLAAHEHYRNGRNEDAITWAYKALESTLKTICDNRNWKYPDNATAVTLIEVVIDKHLAPDYLSSHMNGLRSAMTSGVPTLRNKGGGHGQGAKLRVVPDSMAAFALHLTASNIVFLVERHKELS